MKSRSKLIVVTLAAIMVLMIPLGAMAAPQQGWSTDKTSKWSYYANGKWCSGGWHSIGGEWYLFDSNGYMLTGWQINGNTWYYLKTSGAMATGWQQLGGRWYYFKASGAMATGWVSIGGQWYYMGSNGAMLASQWLGDYEYYLGADGAWVQGMQKPNTPQTGDTWTGEIWIAENGDRYHDINNCGNMKPNKATKITLDEARRLGLKPCTNCNPPR